MAVRLQRGTGLRRRTATVEAVRQRPIAYPIWRQPEALLRRPGGWAGGRLERPAPGRRHPGPIPRGRRLDTSGTGGGQDRLGLPPPPGVRTPQPAARLGPEATIRRQRIGTEGQL